MEDEPGLFPFSDALSEAVEAVQGGRFTSTVARALDQLSVGTGSSELAPRLRLVLAGERNGDVLSAGLPEAEAWVLRYLLELGSW